MVVEVCGDSNGRKVSNSKVMVMPEDGGETRTVSTDPLRIKVDSSASLAWMKLRRDGSISDNEDDDDGMFMLLLLITVCTLLATVESSAGW